MAEKLRKGRNESTWKEPSRSKVEGGLGRSENDETIDTKMKEYPKKKIDADKLGAKQSTVLT